MGVTPGPGISECLVRPEWLFEVSQRLQVFVLSGSASALEQLRTFLRDCVPDTVAEHRIASTAIAWSRARGDTLAQSSLSPADAPDSPRTRFLTTSVARAAAVLGTHYQRRLTLDSLAMLVHCNRTDLARSFRKHYGHSIHAHLTAHRLEAAKRLLRDTGWRIDEVARGSGFRSRVSLYTHFRRSVGCTPDEYRHRWTPAPLPLGELSRLMTC